MPRQAAGKSVKIAGRLLAGQALPDDEGDDDRDGRREHGDVNVLFPGPDHGAEEKRPVGRRHFEESGKATKIIS
jgi:hypothetical protein